MSRKRDLTSICLARTTLEGSLSLLIIYISEALVSCLKVEVLALAIELLKFKKLSSKQKEELGTD